MKVTIEVPDYSQDTGIRYEWEDGFEIQTSVANDGIIKIVANKEWLLSLANHLVNLAQDEIPSGHHMHFDNYSGLKEWSVELLIEKDIQLWK